MCVCVCVFVQQHYTGTDWLAGWLFFLARGQARSREQPALSVKLPPRLPASTCCKGMGYTTCCKQGMHHLLQARDTPPAASDTPPVTFYLRHLRHSQLERAVCELLAAALVA